MEFTKEYILSQIFTIILYVLVALTYYAKNRKSILVLNLLALISNGLAYVFLNAWSGLVVSVIAIFRNVIFMIDEKVNGKNDIIIKKDIIIIVIIFIILCISAIFTYEGILSLFSVFATMLSTFALWQKKTKVYKILGVPISMLWIAYNISVNSILGIILESIILICSVTGYILEVRENKIITENK